MRPELADEPRDVDHLQDQVRRVEVEPDRAAPLLEDATPDARRRREVVPARPLVVAEEHRAVLDRDLPAVVLRERHDVRPDLERLLPVRVLGLCSVGAHERVDEGDVHLLGGRDHVLEVTDDGLTMRRVRMERVRVVAQPGDRQALAHDLVDDLGRLRCGEVRDIDVGRAGVAAGRPARARPAGDLDAFESVGGGPVHDLAERRLGEGRGQQTEPHRTGSEVTGFGVAAVPLRSTSTHRPSRALRAIASPTSISSWPSANVG